GGVPERGPVRPARLRRRGGLPSVHRQKCCGPNAPGGGPPRHHAEESGALLGDSAFAVDPVAADLDPRQHEASRSELLGPCRRGLSPAASWALPAGPCVASPTASTWSDCAISMAFAGPDGGPSAALGLSGR